MKALALLLVTFLAGCAGPRVLATPRDDAPASPLAALPYQHSVGGRFRTTINAEGPLGPAPLFATPTDDPREERRRIRQAIARIERLAGEQTGTHADKPRGLGEFGELGQLDCVDESTNTTEALIAMTRLGWIRRHEVLEPGWRFAFLMFDSHRSARIREIGGGVYAVDSWVGANGEPPDIQPWADWERKSRKGLEE